MSQCVCNDSLKNLRGNSCAEKMRVTKGLTWIPEIGSDGTKNEIANEAGVTISALTALINSVDKLDRYYPVFNNLQEVEWTPAIPEMQIMKSGDEFKAENGISHFKALLSNADRKFLNKLLSIGCNKGGFFFYDKIDNFIYYTDKATETKVQPLLIQEGSFKAYPKQNADKEIAGIYIEFNFRRNNDESLVRVIPANDLDFSPLNDLYSLYDVKSVNTAVSATSLKVALTDDYGKPVSDLVAGDFTLYNITDSAPVTILTAVESPVGVYTLTYASQTVADILRITPSKAGYDFALVVANVATVA